MQRHDRMGAFGAAGWGLAVLSFINLFNYLDRYLVPALFESLKRSELRLSDGELGLLMSVFLAVYTLSAPAFGTLGDRRARPRLIAFGVGCWSLATTLSGLAGSYAMLLVARAAVGIGEAAYGTIAPSLLADYFPAGKRARIMGVFFCAIPLGSALGYIVGGLMSAHWRAAFFVAGIPGVVLAAACLWLREPRPSGQAGATSPRATFGLLLRNAPYRYTVLGYAAYTFAMGGLASWMPAFLERVHGLPAARATVQFGEIVVVTGLVGTFAGGWLGDRWVRRSSNAYLLLCAAATSLAAPLVWFALTAVSQPIYLGCMVGAQLLLFLSTAPVNASILNLVPPAQRASAVALNVFAIHVLGDALSPYLIGTLSDASSLAQAVKIVPVAVLVAGALWARAARAAHGETHRQ